MQHIRNKVGQSILALSMAVALLAGCSTENLRTDSSLYHDLGEVEGITDIFEAFVLNIATDKRISWRFAESDISRFRDKGIEHIVYLTGGPLEYTGDTMELTHAGMGIDDADFNAVVENLIEAMEELEVPTGTQNRLLAILAPLHDEIVEAE